MAKGFLRLSPVLILSLVLLSACSSSRSHLQYDPYAAGQERSTGYAVASWYGPDFHGKPTASGEIYDMYANTCAHRTLPFGTRVGVKNASNGKESECIVNDRGPFVAGRDIDLSYATARDIGLVKAGVGTVMLDVRDRDRSYIKSVRIQTSERKGPFIVQVGSFSESINAVRLKLALKIKYENVFIEQAEVDGRLYYRVRVGEFSDFASVMAVAQELGNDGFPTVVMQSN